MDDLLSDFLTEAAESLGAAETHLVRFEGDPHERESLHAVLRELHGVKGTSGVLGLHRLASLAHALEGLLTRLRDGAPASPELVTLALSALDQLREVLRELELFGAEPEGDDRGLIARLEAAARFEPQPRPWPQRPPPAPAELDSFKAVFVDDPPAPAPPPATPPPAPTPARTSPAPSVRVGAGVLDELMAQVGELVLTRNQLLQVIRTVDDGGCKAPLQRLSVLTGELQESVLRTRMQPVGELWRTLPRAVRDLAGAVGKRIDLVAEGEAVELDREVLDRLKEPLLHLLRNAADHGLEPVAERRAAGKPEVGTLRVSARHEGGCAVITVADDGRGLDTEKIRRRAVARGLVSATAAAGLSDAETHRFIFSPGFSTADAVTGLSGRGVGLDAARTQIQAMGGEIDVSTAPGQGLRVSLRIPLSLSIVSALIVEAGGHRFALPQLNVQAVSPAGAEPGSERSLPRLDLSVQLELPPDPGGPLLVVHGGGRVFALGVGRVLEAEEIVVKPFARLLDGKPAYAGATVLSDGSVALVLNPAVLAEAATPPNVDAAAAPVQAPPSPVAFPEAGGRRVLLIDGNDAFREMLAALLTSAGCEVVAAASAAEAWRLQDESFDAVVSDIEAAGPKGPGVPGRPRGDSRWSQAALIALTTLPVGAGLRPGPDGGFAAIVRRADRRGLFDALERALGAPISAAA